MTLISEADWDELFAAARDARKHAYAPYSRFHVGAAILTGDGRVFSGCNVENAAYPVGTCAEAGAIAAMIAAGAKRIAAIAVIGPFDDICAPCGACRQRIFEFADASTRIGMTGANMEKRLILSPDELLPHAFGPDNLPVPGD